MYACAGQIKKGHGIAPGVGSIRRWIAGRKQQTEQYPE
jgi:hypothetical protein